MLFDCCLLPVVNCALFVVCCLLMVVCCLLRVFCCSVFVVGCWWLVDLSVFVGVVVCCWLFVM